MKSIGNKRFAFYALHFAFAVFAAAAAVADTYTAVEYIESDGDQYIDTQFTMGSAHAATLDFQPTVLPTVSDVADPNGHQSLFGCRNGAASKNISFFIDSAGLGIDFNNGSYSTYRLHPFAVDTSKRYAAATAAAAANTANAKCKA